jgi:hypothetical protein
VRQGGTTPAPYQPPCPQGVRGNGWPAVGWVQLFPLRCMGCGGEPYNLIRPLPLGRVAAVGECHGRGVVVCPRTAIAALQRIGRAPRRSASLPGGRRPGASADAEDGDSLRQPGPVSGGLECNEWGARTWRSQRVSLPFVSSLGHPRLSGRRYGGGPSGPVPVGGGLADWPVNPCCARGLGVRHRRRPAWRTGPPRPRKTSFTAGGEGNPACPPARSAVQQPAESVGRV